MKSLGARTIGIAVFGWHCLFSGAGFAQESSPPKLGEEFELAVHQTAQISAEKISVTFQEVLEDSRCPVDVTCIWAGLAEVSLQVAVSGQEREISLSTLSPEDSAVFENYTFLADQRETGPSCRSDYGSLCLFCDREGGPGRLGARLEIPGPDVFSWICKSSITLPAPRDQYLFQR